MAGDQQQEISFRDALKTLTPRDYIKAAVPALLASASLYFTYYAGVRDHEKEGEVAAVRIASPTLGKEMTVDRLQTEEQCLDLTMEMASAVRNSGKVNGTCLNKDGETVSAFVCEGLSAATACERASISTPEIL